MARKNYQVKTKTAEGWQRVHKDLVDQGAVQALVPTRKVSCKNPLLDSPKRGVYQLSSAEVEDLRLHPDVSYVELDPSYHPYDEESMFQFDIDRFPGNVKNYRQLVEVSSSSAGGEVEVANSLVATTGVANGDDTVDWVHVSAGSGNSPAMQYWNGLPSILKDYAVYPAIPSPTNTADPLKNQIQTFKSTIEITTSGPHQLIVVSDGDSAITWKKQDGITKAYPPDGAWDSNRNLNAAVTEDYLERGIKYQVINLGYITAGAHTLTGSILNDDYPNQAFENWDYNPAGIGWKLIRLPINGYTYDVTHNNDGSIWNAYPASGNLIIPKTNPTSAETHRTGYQTLRTAANYNSDWGSNPAQALSKNISYTNDGRDVDIIIVDDGVWYGHPEFKTTDNDPPNWIPGNVLSRHGRSSVLDIVLDAPYYFDPEWFDAVPSRTVVRWDGTRVPNATDAISWWEDRTKRSSKFGGTDIGEITFGTYVQGGDYNRAKMGGTENEPPLGVFQTITGETVKKGKHGTPCASLAYGKTFGWAFNANKWTIVWNHGGVTLPNCMKMCRMFHKLKPSNPKFPSNPKDPTISSNSWSSSISPGHARATGTRSYEYRGTSGTYNASNATSTGSRPPIPNFIHRGRTDQWEPWEDGGDGFSVKLPSYYEPTIDPNTGDYDYSNIGIYSTYAAEIEEAVESGVIFAFSAGNEGNYFVDSTSPDFNNKVGSTSASPEFYTNRAKFPSQIGYNPKTPIFTVGAMDDAFMNRIELSKDESFIDDATYFGEKPDHKNYTKPPANAETIAQGKPDQNGNFIFGPRQISPQANMFNDFYIRLNDYSNYGSFIDLYAPGDGTLAASGDIDSDFLGSSYQTYYERTDVHPAKSINGDVYLDRFFGGTSASCPIVAGHLAAAMQQNRGLTPKLLKEAILGDNSDLTNFYKGLKPGSDANDPLWLANYSLHGDSAKVIQEYAGPSKVTTENASLTASGGISLIRPINERFTLAHGTSDTHKLKIYGIREFLETDDTNIELTLADGYYPISITTDTIETEKLGVYKLRVNPDNDQILEATDNGGTSWDAFSLTVVNGNFYSGNKDANGNTLGGKLWYRLNLRDDTIGLPTTNDPTYNIVPSNFTINEGGSLQTVIKTTNVDDNTTLYWSITGDITSADLQSGTMEGSSIVTNGQTPSINHVFSPDSSTEGTEAFEFKVFTDSARNNQVRKISLTLLDTSTSTGSSEPDPFTPGTDGYNDKVFPDNIKRTHTNGDTTVETAGPYFVGSGAISFSEIAKYFKQTGYTPGTTVKASDYFRNTDNTQTGVNVPNATENEFDTAGSTKIAGDPYPDKKLSTNASNLSIKTFRGSIKRYYGTCGSISNVGGTVISQYNMGRWDGSKGIDWDNRNSKDTTSRSDGNLIRNVEKNIFINATCYSDDTGTNGTVGSLVSGAFDKKAGARLVEPTLAVRNSIIFVNGRCFGSGGFGGYRVTGAKGTSDPGKHGGPGLKVKHIGSRTDVYVWKDAQIFGGGGGGESGAMGAPGAAGVCQDSTWDYQTVSFCPKTAGGGFVLTSPCSGGYEPASGWTSTADPCLVDDDGNVLANSVEVTCRKLIDNSFNQTPPTQGIGGRGGNGKGYNQSRTQGQVGTEGINPSCGSATLTGGSPAGDGEDGGHGGDWGVAGGNTNGITGDGGNGGAAICGTPFKLKGPYISASTIKGLYNGECDGTEQTIDPTEPTRPTLTINPPDYVRFNRNGMHLMVTAKVGTTVKFRIKEQNFDKTGYRGVPFKGLTIEGITLNRGDGIKEWELGPGIYDINWNELNNTNISPARSSKWSGVYDPNDPVNVRDVQMANDMLSMNLKDDTSNGSDAVITILNEAGSNSSTWVKSFVPALHDETHEAKRTYWHRFLANYGVYKSYSFTEAPTFGPGNTGYHSLTYTFKFHSGDRGGGIKTPAGDYPLMMMSDNAGQVWVDGVLQCHTSTFFGHDNFSNYTDPNPDANGNIYTEKHVGVLRVAYPDNIDFCNVSIEVRIKNNPYDNDTPPNLIAEEWNKNPAGIAFAAYPIGTTALQVELGEDSGDRLEPIGGFSGGCHSLTLPGESRYSSTWSFNAAPLASVANVLGDPQPLDTSFYCPTDTDLDAQGNSGPLSIRPGKHGNSHVKNKYTIRITGIGNAEPIYAGGSTPQGNIFFIE